ncbi:MAG: hypothetical protein ACLS43_10805 [Evtepia gabavorous]
MYEDYETGLLTRPNDVETIGRSACFWRTSTASPAGWTATTF